MQIVHVVVVVAFILKCGQAQFGSRSRSEAQRRLQSYNLWLQLLSPDGRNPPYFTTPRTTITTTSTTTTSTTSTTSEPSATRTSSPAGRLASVIETNAGNCGLRSSDYLPQAKRFPNKEEASTQRPRRGRIVWDDDDSQGAAPPPRGTFPWMVSLFVLLKNGEALFMCAATLLTPNLAVTAAHCFTNNEKRTTWFARVGDNYILSSDPQEQTFRVSKIIKHGKFKPLSSDGSGDGRHDIALVVFQPHRGARDVYGNSNQDEGFVQFGSDVRPICTLPQSEYPLQKLTNLHCEIAGWGMTEYNNTNSYPDSIRAAQISVGDVSDSFCNYLYKRNVHATGKFCAGRGGIDACQEDSGGPLVCQLEDGRFHLVGIVSSGKGCGIYPGLFTDVSRYMDWLAYWVEKETVK